MASLTKTNRGTCIAIRIAVSQLQPKLSYRGYSLSLKQQITEIAANGSEIWDTARVLKISPTSVVAEIRKKWDVL